MSDHPDMHCNEFVERVTDYLEGALPPADLARLEIHLAECEYCTRYLAQLRITLELTGALAVSDVTPNMRGDLLDAFASWNAGR